MAGPIFVVELEPDFPSKIQAQSRLAYYRRYCPWSIAKIVRIDEQND
jgi:hypothetical protein